MPSQYKKVRCSKCGKKVLITRVDQGYENYCPNCNSKIKIDLEIRRKSNIDGLLRQKSGNSGSAVFAEAGLACCDCLTVIIFLVVIIPISGFF
jgi:DNA-directed RNA polymerase subunit RPC12/RpoP